MTLTRLDIVQTEDTTRAVITINRIDNRAMIIQMIMQECNPPFKR